MIMVLRLLREELRGRAPSVMRSCRPVPGDARSGADRQGVFVAVEAAAGLPLSALEGAFVEGKEIDVGGLPGLGRKSDAHVDAGDEELVGGQGEDEGAPGNGPRSAPRHAALFQRRGERDAQAVIA